MALNVAIKNLIKNNSLSRPKLEVCLYLYLCIFPSLPNTNKRNVQENNITEEEREGN